MKYEEVDLLAKLAGKRVQFSAQCVSKVTFNGERCEISFGKVEVWADALISLMPIEEINLNADLPTVLKLLTPPPAPQLTPVACPVADIAAQPAQVDQPQA